MKQKYFILCFWRRGKINKNLGGRVELLTRIFIVIQTKAIQYQFNDISEYSKICLCMYKIPCFLEKKNINKPSIFTLFMLRRKITLLCTRSACTSKCTNNYQTLQVKCTLSCTQSALTVTFRLGTTVRNLKCENKVGLLSRNTELYDIFKKSSFYEDDINAYANKNPFMLFLS